MLLKRGFDSISKYTFIYIYIQQMETPVIINVNHECVQWTSRLLQELQIENKKKREKYVYQCNSSKYR